MPNRLSERERRFVDSYMGQCSGNATQAAIAAGYAKKSAPVTASRLIRKANVRAAIDARVKADPVVLDREQLQQFWTGVVRAEGEHHKASLKDRLRASELLGRSQALFIERLRHEGLTLEELVSSSWNEQLPNERPFN